ncbi:MAG TPA: MFS transporter [Firmicutes bacterium]|jgi:sugar (glycoside-pentoside-hexuronide) transporter|nr:MFS transporter [Bacillota bacterium]
MDKRHAPKQTSRAEGLSYGGFFLGQNIIYIIQYQYLLYFYTEYVGLSIESTAAMMLIARLWDALNDPIMGALVDKINLKSGKYLPWLKFATYLLPLSLLLVFVNINGSYSLKLVYAYATFLFWDMVYTVSDAPLFSLSTAMTSNIFERDKLLSYGRFAAALAAIISAAFMGLKAGLGWTGAVAVFMGFSFLVMMPLQFAAKERVPYQRSTDITFRQIFKYLFRNKYLLIYYAGFLAVEGTKTLQIMATYFANSNLGNEGLVLVIMAITVIPTLFIAPFLPKLIQWIGKKKLTIYSCIWAIALSLVQYFVGYANFELFLFITAIRVLFMMIPVLIYGMFTADCIEYGAHINGERTEGISFALQTFVTKLAAAICSVLCLMLLKYFGYVEQAVQQSERTLHGIWIILSLVPIVGYVGMLIAMAFYKLDERTVQQYIDNSITASAGAQAVSAGGSIGRGVVHGLDQSEGERF